ncbi:MAG: class IV adenylate cyclase [Candidatus Thorarchaeota archaeon]|jgi:adenylate cyclase class 2
MSESRFEVEVKIPLQEPEQLRAALLEIGARKLNTETQVDAYYDHPCRSFPDTDEAIRIRSRQPDPDHHRVVLDERPLTEMTYKGPKIDPLSKTRLELSVGLDDSKEAGLILKQLGFKEVAEVTKIRAFYAIRDITVSIDDVIDVGLFLELERVVDDENQVASARNDIFEVVRELGLNPEDSIRTSYLELYQEDKSL